MSTKRAFLVLMVLWCGGASVASAAVILDAAGAGTVERRFAQPLGNPFGTTTYVFGTSPVRAGEVYNPACFGCSGGPTGSSNSTWRGYYLFDLSTIGFEVTQATLQLSLSSSGLGGITLFALETLSATQLSGLSGASSQSMLFNAYNDIGSGSVYGSSNVAEAGAGTYTFDLTGVALASINATNGLFAMGVAGTFDILGPYSFYGVESRGASLTLAAAPPPQTVPVAGTLGLLALGGVLLLRQRRYSGT